MKKGNGRNYVFFSENRYNVFQLVLNLLGFGKWIHAENYNINAIEYIFIVYLSSSDQQSDHYYYFFF